MTSLTTIYGAIKKVARERDFCWTTFAPDHPDRAKVYNLNNHIVNALIQEYKTNGGKRDVSRFCAEDKEIPGAEAGEPSRK